MRLSRRLYTYMPETIWVGEYLNIIIFVDIYISICPLLLCLLQSAYAHTYLYIYEVINIYTHTKMFTNFFYCSKFHLMKMGIIIAYEYYKVLHFLLFSSSSSRTHTRMRAFTHARVLAHTYVYLCKDKLNEILRF